MAACHDNDALLAAVYVYPWLSLLTQLKKEKNYKLQSKTV